MTFKYKFEMMDMGDEICAVPVGEGSEEFHGMIRLNKEAAEIFSALSESSTPEEALAKLKEKYPDEDINELGDKTCEMLNTLIAEGVIEIENQS